MMGTEKTLGQKGYQTERVLGKRRVLPEGVTGAEAGAGMTVIVNAFLEPTVIDGQVQELTELGFTIEGTIWWLLGHDDELMVECPNSPLLWVVEVPIKNGLTSQPSLRCPLCWTDPAILGQPLLEAPENVVIEGDDGPRPVIWVRLDR